MRGPHVDPHSPVYHMVHRFSRACIVSGRPCVPERDWKPPVTLFLETPFPYFGLNGMNHGLPRQRLGHSHFSRGQRSPIHLHAISRKRTRQPQLLAVSKKDPRCDTEQDGNASQYGPRIVRAQVAIHWLRQERHEARDYGPDKGKARERRSAVQQIRVGQEATERVGDLVDGEADGYERERGDDPGQARHCWRYGPCEPEEADRQGWGGEGEAHDFVLTVGS